MLGIDSPFPKGLAELVKVYGDPRPLLNPNGTIDPEVELKWRAKTLGRGKLPFPIPINMGQPEPAKKTFYAHQLLVEPFERVFHRIQEKGLSRFVKSWGGIYVFRAIRGGRVRLSTHVWGAGVDLNPEENKLGTTGKMHPGVVNAFKSAGFTWGGDFNGRKDPMHFQAASGY